MLDPRLDAALKKTSRSFALSLRFLPGETRRCVALAYLFARAADTVADTRVVPPEVRHDLLGKLGSLVRARPSEAERAARGPALEALVGALRGPVEVPEERALLESLPLAFELWDELPRLERELSEKLLAIIVSGMERDLERFPPEASGEVRALESREDLYDYCYRVAGCVGEFWTELHAARLSALVSWEGDRPLLERARRFGRALQLTNVLRDVPRDLRSGRCYLPRRELASLGLVPEDLLDPASWPRVAPLFLDLLRVADQDARAGWRYTLAIPWRCFGLRLATALPLLLAHPTLGLLREGNPLDPAARRKVSRGAVLRAVASAMLALPSDPSLKRLFRRVAREAGFPDKVRRVTPIATR